VTYDNGKEFAAHGLIAQQLNSTAYFDRPFTSSERGGNEHLNGYIHQYIPKKRAMFTVSEEEIRMIQNRLNNEPENGWGSKHPQRRSINHSSALRFENESAKYLKIFFNR